jgi:ABC-type microcin C transport system permease subunit YejB
MAYHPARSCHGDWGFAALTMLTKNAFLDEIRKQYVVTARAKGVSEQQIMWKHVFRNAMLLVIASFPATFISMFYRLAADRGHVLAERPVCLAMKPLCHATIR